MNRRAVASEGGSGSVAADRGTVVLKVGAAGGSVTLLGRTTPDGGWRFARATSDHTVELLGGADAIGTSGSPQSEWVDSWQEGLRLLDRYPWVRLHPMEVRPEFVERVRVAVAERLTLISDRWERERAGKKWERVLDAAEATTA